MLFARRLRGTKRGRPPLGPWVGCREARSVFADHREKPRHLAQGRAWLRGVCRARREARSAFQSPQASCVSLASLSPADPLPRSLATSLRGRHLVAIGAPGTSLRGAGGLCQLTGVVCSAPAAFSRGAALAETSVTFPALRFRLASRPSTPRGRVSVGRDCVVCGCAFAQADAHWQTHPHFIQPSQHPQTTEALSTVHRL